MDKLRLDKWLWAARFFKTRSLAAREVTAGRVKVNGKPAKPAYEIVVGNLLTIHKAQQIFHVRVCALSSVRGPAPVAARLYAETAESLADRARQAEQRRLAPEPARSLAAGRPTKRDRRLIDRMRGR